MLRWLPVVIGIALIVYCLVEAVQAEDRDIRTLPRWGWILLIVLFPVVGSIAWLIAGRPDAQVAPETSSGPGRGPDDDAGFLENLRHERERRERLESWEDDLRRREGDLRPPQSDDSEPPGSPNGIDKA